MSGRIDETKNTQILAFFKKWKRWKITVGEGSDLKFKYAFVCLFVPVLLFSICCRPPRWILTIGRETQHAVWRPSDHHLLKDDRKTVHISLAGAFT